MEFLSQQNARIAGVNVPDDVSIMATGKHVIVIGGGDTGRTASARRSAMVRIRTQLELPQPPERENMA